ncbi:MAG TPA: flagellar hook-associated protein FlgK [Alphaproteobacteria bacterium]|nr:flagellar hook-associated protein FlgK [Alphaproteobacteria bacterium]
MGLEIALSNALSGLQANQTALQITSNNVSNAQTPGYSAETVAFNSVSVDGEGAGVDIGAVTRNVSQQLLAAVVNETSAQSFAQTTSDQLSQLQDYMGNPNNSSSIASQLSGLATALQSLATTPSGSSEQMQVVAAAQQTAQTFNTLAQNVQALRADTDQSIQNAVNDAQTQLATIQQLNTQIRQLNALGQSTVNLQDQEDVAVNALAGDMNITTVQRSDGTIGVYTTTGVALLDGTGPAPTLTHAAVSSMGPNVTYPGGGINGIMLNGVDITSQITGGSIGALLQLRDTTLPQVGQQLDALANTTIGQLNAIHNSGTSVPAANSLTSATTGLTAATAFTGTGTVRIAIVDQNGNAVAAPLDLDISTVTNVGQLISAINTGLGGAGTAALVNGQLTISANNAANGVAINQEDTNVNASGQGFSTFLGMNNLFVANPAVSTALTMAVRPDIAADPNIVSTGTLVTGAVAVGANAVAPSDNSIAQSMANMFNNAVSIPAAGGLGAANTTVGDYASQIIGNAAVQSSTAQNTASYQSSLLQNIQNKESSLSGVNVDQEMSNLIVYQNAYSASARVISVIDAMFQTLEQIQ